ncbi:MAG: alpha/beta hydrolase [Actinobacteria bacterium]|nr:alpha/beta hydrolase [Actinomycetota bacterium]
MRPKSWSQLAAADLGPTVRRGSRPSRKESIRDEAERPDHDDRGAGEAIVLVPGGLTGWLSWMPHQERLVGSYRVVRVQPLHNELGSAGQPGRPGYTAEVEREALRMTLDELGLDRTHLAGWSGGGKAVLEFAMEYPDRVETLTLVEPAAYWILEQLGEQVELLDELNGFLTRCTDRRSPKTIWQPSWSTPDLEHRSIPECARSAPEAADTMQ